MNHWWEGASDPQTLTEPYYAFSQRYYDTEDEIHKRLSWNWENISKSGPKIRRIITKNWNLMKRCIGSGKPHRTFFPFSEDITMLTKWFISAFHEIEKISQNLGLKLGQKLWKIESLKNGIFDEKVHRIHKTSQNRFPLLASYYDAWSSNSSAHFLKLRKYLKIWAQNLGQKLWKIEYEKLNLWWKGASDPIIMKNWIFDEKVHRIPKTSRNRFSLFRKILRCWRRDS